jgi:MFS family permease
LVIILDAAIVTVALPPIQRHLGFSAANLSGVMNVYLIAFGSLLLLARRLGDLVGRKRMARMTRGRAKFCTWLPANDTACRSAAKIAFPQSPGATGLATNCPRRTLR